jgi:hypothetical protein
LLNSLTIFDDLTSGKKNRILLKTHIKDFLNSKKFMIFGTSSEYPLTSDDLEMFELFNEIGLNVVIICNLSNKFCEIGDFPPNMTHEYQFYVRKNYGYDLAVHKDALTLLPHEIHELILLNSSVHWNGRRLLQILNEFRSFNSQGILGATESIQGSRHTQSFFYYASNSTSSAHLKIFF